MKEVIVAGNYREFMNWCRENKRNPREAIYLSSPEKIMGLRNFKVIKIGTWYARPDLDKIERELGIENK